LPGSLARQSCPAVLPGSLARQSCPAVLPSSLARQSCPAVFSTWSDLFRLVQTCLYLYRICHLDLSGCIQRLRLVVNFKQISCPSTRVRTDLFSLVGERFFVGAKLIYSSRPNCAHGLPRLPGSYSHTQAVLQTDTLLYTHCAFAVTFDN
jgi:hypothetical protein